jgi:hypothetical protein
MEWVSQLVKVDSPGLHTPIPVTLKFVKALLVPYSSLGTTQFLRHTLYDPQIYFISDCLTVLWPERSWLVPNSANMVDGEPEECASARIPLRRMLTDTTVHRNDQHGEFFKDSRNSQTFSYYHLARAWEAANFYLSTERLITVKCDVGGRPQCAYFTEIWPSLKRAYVSERPRLRSISSCQV